MGIPAPADASSAPPEASTSTSTPRPTLPPEAIELATKLFNLARAGATTDLAPYLTAGIPPNLTNTSGDTLLMLAAYHGHADTARALLEHGADPDAVNDRGQSIIAGAVFKGWDEVVRVLFRAGADVRRGVPSAVDAARVFRRFEYLELFGVDVEAEERDRPLEGIVTRPPAPPSSSE